MLLLCFGTTWKGVFFYTKQVKALGQPNNFLMYPLKDVLATNQMTDSMTDESASFVYARIRTGITGVKSPEALTSWAY